MDEMEQTGLAAAAAYLERVGFVDVEPCCEDLAQAGYALTAVDGREKVVVSVTVSLRPGESGEPKDVVLPDGFDRVDAVDVMVLAPDRALLRHHRGLVGR